MAAGLDQGDLREDELGAELSRPKILDAQGAKPLSTGEQANLDQTEAGLKNGDSAKEPSDLGASKSPGGGQKGGGSGGLAGFAKSMGGYVSGNKKKIGLIAGLVTMIVTAFLSFGLLIPLKLIHLREVMDEYFGNRSKYVTEQRAGKVWKLVVDKDGNASFAKTTGHPLADHINNIASSRVVADLRLQGLNASLDPKFHRITIDGQSLDGKISDQRSAIRQKLKEIYPEDGFLKRSVRAKVTFQAFGIQRTFFENTKKAVADWEKEMKTRLRERLFGSAPDAISAAASKSTDPNQDSASSKAVQDLNNAVGDEPTKLHDKALADPSFQIPEVDPSIDPGELAKSGATDAAKGALNVTYAFTQACNIKNLMTEVRTAAKIFRARSLARYAGTILVAADQLKTGNVKNPKELDALMTSINGIEQSGGFQLATGLNPKASLKTTAKYSLDLTKQGGKAGYFVGLSNTLDKIPGGGLACGVATNIFFQIGSTIATVVGDFFSAGGLSITSIAASTSVSVAIGSVEQILKPMAIQMIAGMTVTGDEPGRDKGDALFGGADVIYNDLARRNGGRKLTAKEVATLNTTIANENATDRSQTSLFTRVASLDNPSSLASKLVFSLPTSFSSLTGSVDSMIASINPFLTSNWLANGNRLLSSVTGTIHAQDVPAVDDPLGVDQYGQTTSELNYAPAENPVSNESYIIDNPANKRVYDDYMAKCVKIDTVDEANAGFCDANDDLTIRIRDYITDLGLSGGIDFMSGSSTTLPNDDGY